MIATLAAVLSLSGAQADYARQAQDLARLATAVESCSHAGYRPIPTSIQTERQAFDARLRSEGLDGARIATLAGDANRVEGNQLARALDMPVGISNEQTRAVVREARGFLYRRCEEAKTNFPTAFDDSADEQRMFLGHIGLWTDNPLIEEVEFYLSSRGACSSFQPPFDAHEAAELLSRPFAEEPAPALAALKEQYRRAYREGLDMGTEFDETQCNRLMTSADRALASGWRAHFQGSPPYSPLSE